jgi:hypothetical protein
MIRRKMTLIQLASTSVGISLTTPSTSSELRVTSSESFSTSDFKQKDGKASTTVDSLRDSAQCTVSELTEDSVSVSVDRSLSVDAQNRHTSVSFDGCNSASASVSSVCDLASYRKKLDGLKLPNDLNSKIEDGPTQPKLGKFPRTRFGNQNRSFSAAYYSNDWFVKLNLLNNYISYSLYILCSALTMLYVIMFELQMPQPLQSLSSESSIYNGT